MLWASEFVTEGSLRAEAWPIGSQAGYPGNAWQSGSNCGAVGAQR